MRERIGTTLSRFIHSRERDHPGARGEFSALIEAIGFAGRVIASDVRKAGLADVLGLAGSANIQGEQQQKLDVIANEAIIRSLEHVGHVCVLASEEMDEAMPICDEFHCGDYAIAFDPLDGSGNVDTNMPMGSIFSIYQRTTPAGGPGDESDFLRTGREQVAAGYVIYGSSTMLVYTSGKGVNGFTLDPEIGAWLLSHQDIKVPERGDSYLVNSGNRAYWKPGVKHYVDGLETPGNGKPYSQRYVGALVADVHRILLKGGIFLYPADSKNPKRSNGKLRMLYECSPLAFVVEQAGGAATDGRKPILDIDVDSLHQRSPLFIGSRLDVAEATQLAATDS